MKVFSKEMYERWMNENGCATSNSGWVDECDGLTEEEMNKRGYQTEEKWMVERETPEEKEDAKEKEIFWTYRLDTMDARELYETLMKEVKFDVLVEVAGIFNRRMKKAL